MVNITDKAFLKNTNLRNTASQATSTPFTDLLLLFFSFFKLTKFTTLYLIYDFNNREYINYIFYHCENDGYCLGLN